MEFLFVYFCFGLARGYDEDDPRKIAAYTWKVRNLNYDFIGRFSFVSLFEQIDLISLELLRSLYHVFACFQCVHKFIKLCAQGGEVLNWDELFRLK